MVYYSFAIIATIFAYLAIRSSEKRTGFIREQKYIRPNSILFFVSFLVYFVPAAFRYSIGKDYFYTYVPMFNWIKQEGISIYTNDVIEYSEWGFNLLNKIIATFTSDSQWVFIVTSAICLLLAYKCIKDYSTDIPLSVFFLVFGSYYLGSYSMIRQAIAIVIFLYSIRFIEKQKIFKYMICMVVAYSIHTSALLYVPFYFLGRLKFSKKQYIIALGGCLVGLNVLSPIVAEIVSLTRFANRINFSSEYNILFSTVVVCVFLFAVYGSKNKEDDSRYYLYLNIHFIAACFVGLAAFLDTTDRIVFLYYYTNFITIPYFIRNANWGRNRKVIIIALISIMSIAWGYEHLYYDQFSVLPYISIFSK